MRFWIGVFLLSLKRAFQKLSDICGTFVVLLLRPKDHERLLRRFYERREAAKVFEALWNIDEGLSKSEAFFVQQYLKGKNSCLILGSGLGREAVALAKIGFRVKGIDHSKSFVEKARRLSEKEGVSCDYLALDYLRPEGFAATLGERFDAVFLSSNMYSTIPTRQRRIAFLEEVRRCLKEDGFFYMEFEGGVSPAESRRYPFKKFLAGLFGNPSYELGDRLTGSWHYMHAFPGESDLRQEIKTAGLFVEALDFACDYLVLRRG